MKTIQVILVALIATGCSPEHARGIKDTNSEPKIDPGSGPQRANAVGPLEYLRSIKGRLTIGGLHNREPNADPNLQSRQLHTITGQYPALYSADFLYAADEIAHRQRMIDQVKIEWNNGAIVQLMWHACNPARSRPCGWDAEGVLSRLSDAEWNQLLTAGTPLHDSWKAMMDEVAVYLQQLKDAGVQVLFRPLHEMNQPVFWWGGRPGPKGTAQLFRLTHDYFSEVKGLDNLIWVWDLQDYGTLASDLDSYDPGQAYYEILALDMYRTDGQGYTAAKYHAVRRKAGDKLIAIGECEELPSVEILEAQPDWVFFMGWSELTFSGNPSQKIRDVYNSSRVVTLNELPGWKTGSAPILYIQAESYAWMHGVIQGPANDGGTGISVGSIDTDDWLTYENVNIPAEGAYTIAYRVASPGGGVLQLERAGSPGPAFGQIAVPKTGGWNDWMTIYQKVTLPAGVQSLGIKAKTGGWNLNWFSITQDARPPEGKGSFSRR